MFGDGHTRITLHHYQCHMHLHGCTIAEQRADVLAFKLYAQRNIEYVYIRDIVQIIVN